MPALTVALLGEPRLRGPQGEIACSAKKSLGLFCFLALSGARHSRRELAQLFWGGVNRDAARASLRTALLRLPAPLAQCLQADRESVALTGPVDVDAARFARLASSDDIGALGEAAALYGGELLKGLEIDATAEFDDWLARERARWRQAAQQLFDKLIERHRERARIDGAQAAAAREAALATARRWCELEPAAEDAHRWLIRLYLEAGRVDAALAQYESCRRELAVAAGRTPGAQTRALVEPLAGGDPAPPPAGRDAGPAAGLPAPDLPGTTFFGRVEELAALEQLLLDPACRLLTLQALGGMGKTRLASVLIDALAPRFAQGATWVALESVDSAARLPVALAQALQIDLPPQAEPATALRRALQGQHRLLVLDNFEHLLAPAATREGDAVGFLLALLQEAPRVRLLVTSREVLGVQEEWIYELRGLPYPVDGDTAPAPGRHAAAELFAQRARQAYAGFSVQAEWPHVVRLCRLVEGMPLALELAAAWVRTVPCGDLVAAVEAEMRSLASRHRNRPERHRHLDAVVRTSWNLLAREQQRALAPLAVFVGGFTQEAAAVVADAPLRLLSALVDKSLVQRRGDGRLGLHELVRQFAREQLARRADAPHAVERRHTRWFADLLVRERGRLDAADGLDAHVALTRDLDNLMAAAGRWEFPAQADRLAEPWLVVLNGRGLQRLALAFADRVLAGAPKLRPATQALVLVQRAVARVGMGDRAGAGADVAQAAAIAREHGLPAVLAVALVHRMLVGLLEDDVAFVEGCARELQPLLPAVDDPGTVVRAHFYQGMLMESHGRGTEALAHYQQTLALAERLNVSQQIQATLKTVVARSRVSAGRSDGVDALLSAAIPVHERAGNRPRLAQALLVQAQALLHAPGGGAAARAAELAQRALAIHEQTGHPPGISVSSHVLGQALRALGRHGEARRLLARAAETASPVSRCEALVDLGLLELDDGQKGRAADVAHEAVALALQHPLPSLRWGSTVLVCSILVREGREPARVQRWLAALLAEEDLAPEHRRQATRLQDALPPLPAAGGEIDAAALQAMLEALGGR